MASKRTAKKAQNIKYRSFTSILQGDVLCPICRSILIEPVTLPCDHSFCFSCFHGVVQNSNLVCPLCRLRITSWYRKTKKAAKLIDEELWNVIKGKFPQQILNKISGKDVDIEEDMKIIVAQPGEIRKEYELHKTKEEEELRKQRQAEAKASEELIRKLREEDEFEKAVMEEKLKMDEKIAKKLAEEMSLESLSKETHAKKQGSLDRFIVKDSETFTSKTQKPLKKPANNFHTKEYTCRVLLLDEADKCKAQQEVFSPIIKKKMWQIQKVVDLDMSDSSDCIESEMRYFKPIDRKFPSQRKPPIRIPPKKAFEKKNTKILSPGGNVNFHPNPAESAFIRISPVLTSFVKDVALEPSSSNLKRRHNNSEGLGTPSKKMSLECGDFGRKSPKLNNCTITKRQLFGKTENCSSPPFYGFKRTEVAKSKDSDKIIEEEVVKRSKINGLVNNSDEDEMQRRLMQEQADLEFAKKLQEELNRETHYTRSTRRGVAPKKQTTLDSMIQCIVK